MNLKSGDSVSEIGDKSGDSVSIFQYCPNWQTRQSSVFANHSHQIHSPTVPNKHLAQATIWFLPWLMNPAECPPVRRQSAGSPVQPLICLGSRLDWTRIRGSAHGRSSCFCRLFGALSETDRFQTSESKTGATKTPVCVEFPEHPAKCSRNSRKESAKAHLTAVRDGIVDSFPSRDHVSFRELLVPGIPKSSPGIQARCPRGIRVRELLHQVIIWSHALAPESCVAPRVRQNCPVQATVQKPRVVMAIRNPG